MKKQFLVWGEVTLIRYGNEYEQYPRFTQHIVYADDEDEATEVVKQHWLDKTVEYSYRYDYENRGVNIALGTP